MDTETQIEWTEEQLVAAVTAYTNSEQAAQLPTLAPSIDLEFPSLGNYDFDLDADPSCLLDLPLGQIPEDPSVLQGDLQQGYASDLMLNFDASALAQYDAAGLQDNTQPGQPSNSTRSSPLCNTTPPTPYDLQRVSSEVAPPTSFPPPPPAGINPAIFTDALQVAITSTAAPAIQPQPTISQAPFFPPPQPPQPPQPQSQPQSHLTMPSLQPETLSDFPQLHRTHHTTGYRDGISHAQHVAAQPAFDAGFPLGVAHGLRAGRALGVVEFATAGEQAPELHEVLDRARLELDTGALVRDLIRELHESGWGVHLDRVPVRSMAGGMETGTGNAHAGVGMEMQMGVGPGIGSGSGSEVGVMQQQQQQLQLQPQQQQQQQQQYQQQPQQPQFPPHPQQQLQPPPYPHQPPQQQQQFPPPFHPLPFPVPVPVPTPAFRPGPGTLLPPRVDRWGPPPTPGKPMPDSPLSVEEALNRWEDYASQWIRDKYEQNMKLGGSRRGR